jgi:hypothetical protein
MAMDQSDEGSAGDVSTQAQATPATGGAVNKAQTSSPKASEAPNGDTARPDLTGARADATATNQKQPGEQDQGKTGAKSADEQDQGEPGTKSTGEHDQGQTDAKPSGASTEPGFEYENDNDKNDKFNLRPLPNRKFPIAEDQRKISQEVYEIRNVLKLLDEHESRPFPKVIKPDVYNEFITRALQAGRVGCVATYVHPILAAGALEQIRADIVRRVGVSLIYSYLAALAVWAVIGLLLGIAVSDVIGRIGAALGHGAVWLPINGYKWLLLGAMAGAWFSVAARRQEVGFDSIPLYLHRVIEPVIRVLFVAVVAAAFALFLHLHFLTINIGNIDFAHFETSISVALFVGFVAGISERALSARLIGEARKAFPGAKSATEK